MEPEQPQQQEQQQQQQENQEQATLDWTDGAFDHRIRQQVTIMNELPVRIFLLHSNFYPEVIRQIAHISFPNLRTISLNENNIETIEPLSRMNMPSLELLHLSQNKITSVSSLVRSNFPRLTDLSLMSNNIRNVQCLTRSFFPHLSQISLKVPIEGDQNNSFDIAFILKLQSAEIQEMQIDHFWFRRNDLFPGSIEKIMQKRFNNPLIE